MATERRQAHRAKPFGLVYLSLASENGGIVVNASEDGLQFQAVAPVENDDAPIPLWFMLNPSMRIEAVGNIVWTDKTKKLGGLRFTNLAEPARRTIRDWLDKNALPSPTRTYEAALQSATEEVRTSENIKPTQRVATKPEPVIEAASASAADNPVESAQDMRRRSSSRSGAAPAMAASAPAQAVVPEPRTRLPYIVPPPTSATASSSPAPSAAPTDVTPGEFASTAPGPARIKPETSAAPVSILNSAPEISAGTATNATQASAGQEGRNSEAEIFDRSWLSNLTRSEEVEPAAPSLSYEAGAGQSHYSNQESEEVLREVRMAAQHRLGDAPATESTDQSTHSQYWRPSSLETTSSSPNHAPRAGISVRTSDFTAPWRPSVVARPTAPEYSERSSRLASFLSEAGVPRDMVRSVEIAVLLLVFIAVAGTALLVFHRSVGNGVQWLGQQTSSQSPAAESQAAQAYTPPSDSQISPLLQPPQSHPERRSLASKHKPKPATASESPRESAATAAAPDATRVPQLPDETGETELANGLQYLRADGGTTETNVAIKWLWASVEKGNTKAAIILADLYGWGRGVPQNCDQARVLLMVASRRGSMEAQQRLQDMEAEGCANSKSPQK